ncbi:DUF3107 domain-containing protein [Naumannella halotolerans]|uniref:DUF3107 domain-containing protein n=1 Tax=Naumannella halotolerans TaxID=993414 RepID=UPI001FBBFD87|nr:DUF3107 domain-containing protein [Naumannella halotolerans]
MDTEDALQEEHVEVKIGMRQVARELTVETEDSADSIQQAYQKALKSGEAFEITDTKGSKVIVRAELVAYLDLGKENPRRVGFGAL